MKYPKGLPILSDCIYGDTVKDRFIFAPGAFIEVEPFGDAVFESVHGFITHGNVGKITIKADGGGEWYVAVQRGADGELLFVAAWLVK